MGAPATSQCGVPQSWRRSKPRILPAHRLAHRSSAPPIAEAPSNLTGKTASAFRGGGEAGGRAAGRGWGGAEPWLAVQRRWLTIFLLAWLAAGLALAAWTVSRSHGALQDERQAALLTWCGERARSLVHQFRSSSDHAMVFTGLVEVFGETTDGNPWGHGSCITRESFQAYVNETSYARPWVSSITWIVFVDHADRADFERRFGIRILSPLTRQASPPRDWYAVFLYVSKGERTNNSDCCYDALQSSRFKEAIMHGQATHNISITPTYTIWNNHPAVGLGFPVLQNTSSGEVVMRGMIGAAIDMQDLIDFLLKHLLSASAPFKLQLYDTSNSTAPVLMYDSDGLQRLPTLQDNVVAPATPAMLQPDRFKHVEPIDLRDPSRQYEMWCRYTEGDTVAWEWSSLSWGVLLLVVFILVFYILLTMGRQNAAMRRNYRRMDALKGRAEAADRAKSNFLATVSHEIRTPMNGVLGMLDFLLDSKLDAQQQEHARMARACGQTLVSLLNDVLDLAKVEADRLELEHLPFNLRAAVDDILDIFRTKAQDVGLELAALVDSSVPEVVVGDRIRLRQVVVNLIGNSIKFTPRGHIFLHVSAPFTSCPVPSSLPSPLALRSRVVTSQTASSPHRTPSPCKQPLSPGTPPWGVNSIEVQVACSPLRRPSSPLAASLLAAGRSLSRTYQTLSGRPSTLCCTPGAAHSSAGAPGCGPTVSCVPGEVFGGCFPALLQGGYRRVEEGLPVDNREDHGDAGHMGEREELVESQGEGQSKERSEAITLLVTCEDTGLGIPVSAQGKIFQPFTQAESSTARTHGGTGIGLTISKRLVKLMGGDMTLVSEPGVGTTFVFTVTLATMPPRPPRPLPPGVPASLRWLVEEDPDMAPVVAALAGRRVLLVDGLAVRQRVAASVLTRLGVTVLPASDAACAIAMAMGGCHAGGMAGDGMAGDGVSDGGEAAGRGVGEEGAVRAWDVILIDKDAFGPRSGFHVARAVRDAQRAGTVADRGEGSAAGEEGGGACEGVQGKGEGGGGSKAVATMILMACKLEAEDKTEADECGFADKLLKPLRKSILAACLIQVLGIKMASSQSGSTEKHKRRKAMEALVGGRKILVVDDNVVNQRVAERMLQRYGVLTHAVHSGTAALAALDEAASSGHPFDAVFMDVQMPGMDGYETTRAIRHKERESGAAALPIFAMTADVISGSRTRCEEAGMDGFIPKPIDEEQLHATLWNSFGRQ
ncbi:unnamed protein product [Closterium sp. Naga37s-1]|nr:unnamed protein product [Closterium sp. Naga37s-1]